MQRRVYCLFEALSITYRSLLPVPAWCQYYTTDAVYGQVFVSVYLVLKILVLARHFRAVFGALQSVASNTLEFGAYAAKEDQGCCPICYGESGSLGRFRPSDDLDHAWLASPRQRVGGVLIRVALLGPCVVRR